MALSADRVLTVQRDGIDFQYAVAASQTFYAGGIVQKDSSGNAIVGAAGENLVCLGVCQEYKAAGVAGVDKVKTRYGVFKFVNGDTITKAHIGQNAYVGDDETVFRAATGRSLAGKIVDVDSTGVFVKISEPSAAAEGSKFFTVQVRDLVGANAQRNGFSSPVAGSIKTIRSVLLGAALTTGNATLTAKINTVAVTTGVVTITQSGSAIGDIDSAVPTALNTVAVGDFVELTVGGTNAQTASFAEVIIEIG